MTMIRLVKMFSKYFSLSLIFFPSLSPFSSLFVFLKCNISEIYDFSARYLDEISYRCADCFFVQPDVPVSVTAHIVDLLFILGR